MAVAGTCGAPCAFGAAVRRVRVEDSMVTFHLGNSSLQCFSCPRGTQSTPLCCPVLFSAGLPLPGLVTACEDGSGHTLFCIMTSHSGFTVVEEHNFRQGDATSDEIEQCVLGECVGVRPGSRRHGVDHSALCQRSRSPSNGPVS